MSIITISRGSKSGGALLAKRLGAALGYRVLSGEVTSDAAKTYGVSEEKIVEGLETTPGLWARVTGHAEPYVLAVQASLAEIVESENAVYHGLAGQFLLRGLPAVLKVRLIAPMEYRIRAVMADTGMSAEQAVAQIQEVDKQRERWVRKVYDADWGDPSHYDVVINLGDMGMDTAVDLLASLLDRKEYKRTAEANRALRDFALTTRVRAHLKFRSSFHDANIEVDTRDGVVRLSGDTSFESRRDGAVRFVMGIPGVRDVLSNDQRTMEVDLADRPSDQTAGDMMIPLDRYPHISEWVTIRDAVVALSASAVKLEDGHLITPRYVLVLDRADNLVGIVGRRDLLRGLSPGIRSLEKAMEAVQGVLPVGSQETIMGWGSLFSPAAMDASRDPVKSVMGQVKGMVNTDDSLSVVVSRMIQHQVDLVPVMDGSKVVGAVLMTDIFDVVAQYLIEHAGTPRPSMLSV